MTFVIFNKILLLYTLNHHRKYEPYRHGHRIHLQGIKREDPSSAWPKRSWSIRWRSSRFWLNGIRVWGSARNSNLEILEWFQNILLHAAWGPMVFPKSCNIREPKTPDQEEAAKLAHKYITGPEDHPNLPVRESLSEVNDPRFWLKLFRPLEDLGFTVRGLLLKIRDLLLESNNLAL